MATIMRTGGGLASAGAGKGLYYVELPRSIYYGDAAEWLVSRPDTALSDNSWQIVCNGELWTLTTTTAYATNLATKEITYTGTISPTGTGTTSYQNNAFPDVTTDGTSRIWFITINGATSTTGITVYLNEFNVLTKEFKSTEFTSILSYASGYTVYFLGFGTLHYSKESNRVYLFGLGANRKTGSSSYVHVYKSCYFDLATNTTTEISSVNSAINNAYAYEKDGYIYIGAGYYVANPSSSSINASNITVAINPNIYRYHIDSNTLTTIRSDFTTHIENLQKGTVLCFVLGDKVVQISSTNTYVFDPTTGNVVEEQYVTPYGGASISGRLKGLYNNVFYAWTKTTDYALMELHFWEDTPEDSPIVAKIYKGQKFHALVPFSLIRQGIEVTTAQQTATEDIEVKMYDYSSEGGQLLYIETT